MARLALAFAAGAALPHLAAVPTLMAALLLLLSRPPSGASVRPATILPPALALLGGAVATWTPGPEDTCPTPRDGARVEVQGRFLAPASHGGVPFSPEVRGCRRVLWRAVVSGRVEAGVPMKIEGRWRMGRRQAAVIVDAVEAQASEGWSPTWALVRWRGHLLHRLEELYGARAPVVSALTLARKEGLDPGLREAFARSGTAHLLAISGFHVGVVASVFLVLLRGAGVRRRNAELAAASGAWLYVALLGFPDAASRAALILAAAAASRARATPPARWGGLGAALLVLLLLDPERITSPGFQLSFAGAAGLVAWGPGLRRAFSHVGRWRVPWTLASGLASGVAATCATLPVVAWHFERVSLLGIPATLVTSPLVAFALTGALASLLVDVVHPALGVFLAGGVDLALVALEEVTRLFAAPAWGSIWVSRTWLGVVGSAGAVGAMLSRRPRVRTRVRRAVASLTGAAALWAWPAVVTLQGSDSVEIVAIDVGQGDALAIRSPRGRWILVDAGPAPRSDARGHPVVRALRDRGVTRLEALIVTHPDLDHLGGVAAVLKAVEVGAVLEPALPTGKEAYVAALEIARTRGVPWLEAEAGRSLMLDGLVLEVLHPPARGSAPEPHPTVPDANETSVVLAVRFGEFDALLTGDAPAEVERIVAGHLEGGLEVLKVAHHGSDTSTDSVLLARGRPHVGLVSVGRGNRYGHPSEDVLHRLRRAGVEVRRTDREGTLRVVGHRDGSFRVEGTRPPGR